jgi:hypothetical protein
MVGHRLRLSPLIRLLRGTGLTTLWKDIGPLLKDRLLTKRKKEGGTPEPPALFQMAAGFWLSQAIYVAAKLGIADLMADGPKSSVEIAAATGADAPSIFRLLRALAGVNVFSHTGADYFVLAPLGEGLLSDAPGSLRATLITLGEIHYRACGDLLHSVRTGSSAFNHVYGMGLFDYLQRNQDDRSAFDEGMSSLAGLLSYAVLCAYDFSGIRHLLDIGGGQGSFVRNILKINPHIKATVFDLPSTVEQAKRRLRTTVFCERLAFASGDFFGSVPEGADAHLLSGIIHDWDADRALTILKNSRRAIAANGRVLLVEVVVPEGGGYCFSKLLDLNMLVMTGGKERTEADFDRLLKAAGYRLTNVIPTLAPQSLIVGIPE